MVSALILAGAVYAMFRALTLRRALVDRQYRDRAFWTAVGVLSVFLFLGATFVDGIFGQTPTTWEGIIVEDVIWGAAFLVLFGWIASNINVAVSADYFNRDALGWRKGGWIATLAFFLFGYILASLPSWWVPQGLESIGNTIVTAAFFVAIGYPTVVLALVYTRIPDFRIKTYTKWVVLTLVSLFAVVAWPSNVPVWLSSLAIIPTLIWIYSIHATVSALAIRTMSLPS